MRAANILHLGIKELRCLARDPVLLFLIVFSFTFAIYSQATALPGSLNRAPIAIVDDDRSPLSLRIASAFYPPYFQKPQLIDQQVMDQRMDAGLDTFALYIPTGFQRDVLAGKQPAVQLNIDATRMSQAFSGGRYIQSILMQEVQSFLHEIRGNDAASVELAIRMRFNPELNPAWFASIMEVMNNVTMLAIVLTGAALIREREHGTIEHLLVMPVTPFEIMTSKVWSMGLVVLLASIASLLVVVQGLLAVPIEGSLILFMVGTALHLFAATSMGIFLGTVARSMPQFALLLMLVLLPLQMLSGAMTPRESMPEFIQFIMSAAPMTHFVALAQAILYRGAGLATVWPQFFAITVIGVVLFSLALARFRRAIATMA